jgi:hypothetical protein
MNTRNLTAFVALASASLLVRGAPALATSVSALRLPMHAKPRGKQSTSSKMRTLPGKR